MQAAFHYIPLHSQPVGKQFGGAEGAMQHTDAIGERLLRLPLWRMKMRDPREKGKKGVSA